MKQENVRDIDQKDETIAEFSNQLKAVREEKAKKHQAEQRKELENNLSNLKNVYLSLLKNLSQINIPDYQNNEKVFIDKIFNKKDLYIFNHGLEIIQIMKLFIVSLDEQYFPAAVKLLKNIDMALSDVKDSINQYLKKLGNNNYDDVFQFYKNINFHIIQLKNMIDAINFEIKKIEIEKSLDEKSKIEENQKTVIGINSSDSDEDKLLQITQSQKNIKQNKIRKRNTSRNHSQRNKTNNLNKHRQLAQNILPDELWLKIASNLNLKELYILRIVCKKLKQIVEDNSFPIIEKIKQMNLAKTLFSTISSQDELLIYIASFLNKKDLFSLRLLNKNFKRITEDKSLPLIEEILKLKIHQLSKAENEETYKNIILEIHKELDDHPLNEVQRSSLSNLFWLSKKTFLKNVKYKNYAAELGGQFGFSCLGCVGTIIAVSVLASTSLSNNEVGVENDNTCSDDPASIIECAALIKKFLLWEVIKYSSIGGIFGFFAKPFEKSCLEEHIHMMYSLQLNSDINESIMKQPSKITSRLSCWKLVEYRDVIFMLTGLILFYSLWSENPLEVNIDNCKDVLYWNNMTYIDINDGCLNSYLDDKIDTIESFAIPGSFFVTFSLWFMLTMIFKATKNTSEYIYHSANRYLFQNNERQPLLPTTNNSYSWGTHTLVINHDNTSESESIINLNSNDEESYQSDSDDEESSQSHREFN